MKKHVKIYMEFFDFGEQDFIPCEICGGQANDIHHIHPRGMGGSKLKDKIENLMALCRYHHNYYGDKKQFKGYLQEIHDDYVKKYLEDQP
jgi:hypothetical protein